METKKLKMSNRKFRCILIPVLSVITLLAVILNLAASALSSTLDTYVGKGENYISAPADKKDWNAQYYDTFYTDGD